jgi:hypothetical protein
MPDLAPGQLFQPEVGARGEPRHLHVLLDHRDEGQKQRAIEPAAVEIVRRDVRGGDDHDAEFEQPREQPAEDHRVGDVGDVEFVEAQQPRILGDGVGGQPDRLGVGDLAVLEQIAEMARTLVDVGHELVEMHPALAHHRRRREEQIHQHGLAAADVAVNVEPAHRPVAVVAAREQARERIEAAARHAMHRQPVLQRGVAFEQALLVGIAPDLAGGYEALVELAGGHETPERTGGGKT